MCLRLDNESPLWNRDNPLEKKINFEQSPKKQQFK